MMVLGSSPMVVRLSGSTREVMEVHLLKALDATLVSDEGRETVLMFRERPKVQLPMLSTPSSIFTSSRALQSRNAWVPMDFTA